MSFTYRGIISLLILIVLISATSAIQALDADPDNLKNFEAAVLTCSAALFLPVPHCANGSRILPDDRKVYGARPGRR